MKVVAVEHVFKFDDGHEKRGVLDKENNAFYFPSTKEWLRFDDKGNCIYSKSSSGFEISQDFDENGKVVHHKQFGNGHKEYERWNEFDEDGNLIHSIDSNRNESWSEYDDNGTEIYKDSDGNIKHFDSQGNLIYLKDKDGYEEWLKYDENGECIQYKNSRGLEEYRDEDGNIISNR